MTLMREIAARPAAPLPQVVPGYVQALREQIAAQARALDVLQRRVITAESLIDDIVAAMRAESAAPSGGVVRAYADVSPAMTLAQIGQMVQIKTDVSVSDMRGRVRTHRLTMARAIFAGAARRSGFSLGQIGKWLGGRDHSTISTIAKHEAAARQFGLDFVPLIAEDYYLVCLKDALEHPAAPGLYFRLDGAKPRLTVRERACLAPATPRGLAWITERLFVGTGARHPDKVVMRFFEVA